MKGLTVYIYKNGNYDYSNGGISARYDKALIIGPGIPKIFEADGLPVLRLEKGNLPGTAKVTPMDRPHKNAWAMFGGCYVATSDSRFCDAVRAICGTEFNGAVPLHDRFE